MKYKVNIVINLISNMEIEAVDKADAIKQAKEMVNADTTLKGISINEPGSQQVKEKKK